MRSFLICSLLLLMPVVPRAQTLPGGSIHLAWDDCHLALGSMGQVNRTFACNSNAGSSFFLFASVIPPSGLQQYVGSVGVFDVQSAAPTLPLWWSFQTGGCRLSTSLTAAPSFGVTSCLDLTDNPQFGGIDYALGAPGEKQARLRAAYAMNAGLAHPVASSEELTVIMISINRNRTTGIGACAGCSTPVCIVFNSLLLDQVDPNLPRGLVTSGEQQFATWQGPSAAAPCPAATATEGRTWGQLKSLYW